jgi:ABC-type multidrug transport system permease subunit
MFRAAWFIATNDLRFMLRRRETLLWTFLVPPFVFFFVGTVTGGGLYTGAGQQIAVQLEANAGFLGRQVIERLEEQSFGVIRFDGDGRLVDPQGNTVEIDNPPAYDDYLLRLRIPTGFTESVLAGRQVALTLENEDDSLSGNLNDFRLYRAVYTMLADVLAASGIASDANARLENLTADDIDRFRTSERTLTLAVSSAGRRIPSGFEQSVPGVTVMFTLLVLLTTGATHLVIERRTGIMRRLASAPIGRGAIVLGKWGGRFGLAIIQVGFALLVGRFVLGVDFGPELPMLIATLLAYMALIASIAVLAGNLATTEAQAVAIGVLTANVLGALGGCFWPIEVTPAFMQQLAIFLPTGWMMDAMHKLMIFGRDWTSALPHLIGMTVVAWLAGIVCARRFRFE